MDTSEYNARDLWGRKFKIVKNGLDEAEVLSFIGGLIDQNNALASKLEHLDSLTKLHYDRHIVFDDNNRQMIFIADPADELENVQTLL